MCKFCESIRTEEDFETEKPYLLFEKQNNNDIQEFHIEVPSDDGISRKLDVAL